MTLSKLVKLGDTDIGAFVKNDSLDIDGGDLKTSSDPIIGSREAVIIEKGMNALELSADLEYDEGEEAYYDVHAYAANLVSSDNPTKCYFGRSDRFFVAELAKIRPNPVRNLGSGGAGLQGKFTALCPISEAFGGTVQTWNPAGETLPQVQTSPFENDGNLNAALYSLVLSETFGVSSPVLSFLDSGDNVLSTITLHSVVLSGEVLSVDRRGHIALLYENDFSAVGYTWTDWRAYAKLVTSLTGNNNDLVFTAVTPNSSGELVSIAYVNPGGTGDLSIGVVGNAITITLGVSKGTIISTAQEIMDAMNANSSVIARVTTDIADNNTGEGVVTAMSKTYLDLDVSVSSGLVIGELREAEIRLEGLFPIRQSGLVATFTPSLSAGVAYLDVSVDLGDTWDEVASSATWTDGEENAIIVPDAEGALTVYLRWRTDADAILTITDLSISQLRYVSSSLVPKIPPYEDGYTKIDGYGNAAISAEFYGRYIP